MNHNGIPLHQPNQIYTFKEFLSSLSQLSGEPLPNKDPQHPTSPTGQDPLINSPQFPHTQESNQQTVPHRTDQGTECLNANKKGKSENEGLTRELNTNKKVNTDLKYCLEHIEEKINNDFKVLHLSIKEKAQTILDGNETLTKQNELSENLQDNLTNYQEGVGKMKQTIDMLSSQVERNKSGNVTSPQGESPMDSNEKTNLIKAVQSRDEIISELKAELSSKEEVFNQIEEMKNNIDDYNGKIEGISGELKKRDDLIRELRNELNSKNAGNNASNAPGEQGGDYKKLYLEQCELNKNGKKNGDEFGTFFKQVTESQEKMKNAYEDAIREILEKNEEEKQEIIEGFQKKLDSLNGV